MFISCRSQLLESVLHGRGYMFVKCANESCSQPFQSGLATMVFRVETHAVSASDSNNCAVGKGRPEVEYHWLCPECLHVILISWFDHQSAGKLGSFKSATKTVHLILLDQVLSEHPETWQEKKSHNVLAARAS